MANEGAGAFVGDNVSSGVEGARFIRSVQTKTRAPKGSMARLKQTLRRSTELETF
jgi:hypothetical protein